MTVSKNVMVFIEQHDNRVADVSLELIHKANELASTLGGAVEGLAVGGPGLQEELERIGQYGCERIYCVTDERLRHFTSVPYAKTVVRAIREHRPRIVLFGASTTGRDLAPRVASELKCGLTADCTDLQIGEHKMGRQVYEDVLLQIRPAWGGNIIATIVSPESEPSMASVREGVIPLPQADPSRSAEIIELGCDLDGSDFPTRVLEVHRGEKKVDLKSARIIVSAGMGASSPKSLQLVQELADVLGGEVGASRPMVDGGYLSKEHQVGQTGTTVRPTLYIACGISGQIQHLAGMSEAKRIVAINRDTEAPIFDIAHYAIVGDVNEVLPRMIKAYREKA